MSVITRIKGWLSKPTPVQPKPVVISPPPAAPARSRFDDPFWVDQASLKGLFGQVKGSGLSLSRKYVFDTGKERLAIDGLIKSEHKDIAAAVWGKGLNHEDITGGKIDINHDGSKFIIILREHSTHYDLDKPDFFGRLKALRKKTREHFGQLAREIDPEAKMADVFSSASREIFSLTLTF